MNGRTSMAGECVGSVPADAFCSAPIGSKTGKKVGVDNNRCLHHIRLIGVAMQNGGSDMEIIEDQAAARAVNAIETSPCMKMLGKLLKNDSKSSVSDGTHAAINGSCEWTIVLDPIFSYLDRVMRVDKARPNFGGSQRLRVKGPSLKKGGYSNSDTIRLFYIVTSTIMVVRMESLAAALQASAVVQIPLLIMEKPFKKQ